jgi:hypothetical protein
MTTHQFTRNWLIDWLWWGETVPQNCGHQLAYCSPPGDTWAWRAMVMMMMMPAGDYSWLVHQSSLSVLPGETSGESRRNGRRSENFAYQYLTQLKGYLTCRKILRHGTSGFTSHPKEGVLRIFIAIKNHGLGRVWTYDPWIQWQAHLPLHHRGDISLAILLCCFFGIIAVNIHVPCVESSQHMEYNLFIIHIYQRLTQAEKSISYLFRKIWADYEQYIYLWRWVGFNINVFIFKNRPRCVTERRDRAVNTPAFHSRCVALKS